MESEEYARAVGKLFLDLRSLEFSLRHFLNELYTPSSTAPTEVPLAVGQVLPSGPLTNHDPLGSLIEKFNRAVADAKKGTLALDPALSDLSDALLHGRIWGSDAQPPARLVRFSTPANGLVTCTFDASIDEAWLEAQRQRVRDAYAHVVQAGAEIHPNWWIPASA
jgi:hypothetical protein